MSFNIEGEVKIYAKEKATGKIIKTFKQNAIVYSARNILADMIADQLAGAAPTLNQIGYITLIDNSVATLPSNVRDDDGDAGASFANTITESFSSNPLVIDLTSAVQSIGALTITNNSVISYSPTTGSVDSNYATVQMTAELQDGILVAGGGAGEDHIKRIVVWDKNPVPGGTPDPTARVFSVATLPTTGVLITSGIYYVISYSYKIR